MKSVFLSILVLVTSLHWVPLHAEEAAVKPRVFESLNDTLKDSVGLGEWESLEMAPNGKQLLGVFIPRHPYAKFSDPVAVLVDLNTWQLTPIDSPHSSEKTDDPFGYSFFPDSKKVVLGSAFGLAIEGVQLFDASTGTLLFKIKNLNLKNATYSVTLFSKTGRYFLVDEAVGDPDYLFNEYIYQLSDNGKKATRLGKVDNVGAGLTFSTDEKTAYFTTKKGAWVAWDLLKNTSQEINLSTDGSLVSVKGKEKNILVSFVENREKNELTISSYDENLLTSKTILPLYSTKIEGVTYGFGSSNKAFAVKDHRGNSWVFASKRPEASDGSSKLAVQVLNIETGIVFKSFEIPLFRKENRRNQNETKVATFENTPFFAVAQEEKGIFEVWNYLTGKRVAALEYGQTSSDAKELQRVACNTSLDSLFLGALTYSKKELSKLLVWDLSFLKKEVE